MGNSDEKAKAQMFLSEHLDILEDLSQRFIDLIAAGDLEGIRLLTRAISAVIRETHRHVVETVKNAEFP